MDRCPYWVRPRLGGCRLPRPGDERRLARMGVTLLVSLVESYELSDAWPGGEREFIEAFEEAGISVRRLPTPDYGAPSLREALEVLEEVREEVEWGGKVVFHCRGGIGRTGTMLAAYLVLYEGMSLWDALEELSGYGARPESPEQVRFLYMLAFGPQGKGGG